jgi:hypothetical protein
MLGRDALVMKYIDGYITAVNIPDFYVQVRFYDEQLDTWGKSFRPTAWNHFIKHIEQVGDDGDKSASFLKILKEQPWSGYQDFSHSFNESAIASAVILNGEQEYYDLFKYVFQRNIRP